MFNSVEYIREICKKKHIPVSLLEKECGFSNGYLNPKKMKKIPYDRAVLIGNYLGITVESILNGNEIPPTLEDEGTIEAANLYPVHTEEEDMLLEGFRTLNETGRAKVIAYMNDLISSGIYKRDSNSRAIDA